MRQIFEPQLDNSNVRPLLENIEIPLINVLAEIEWTGISIDLPWFHSLKERFRRERQKVELQIYSAAGTEFNINSNLQLREILFTRLGLPVLKKTSTGPSTDASVLQELADAGHDRAHIGEQLESNVEERLYGLLTSCLIWPPPETCRCNCPSGDTCETAQCQHVRQRKE